MEKEEKKNEFKPSSFMRMRRPHEFSDTKYSQKPQLTKSIIEYHLETLTNRKQESLFENFCIELCQKEICPNLIPQTGPVGGGDSKRDTENYPISEEIAFHYYYAIPEKALKDKWAFAFSAKKTWKSKVDSDVKKISTLQRKFDLIYFVSNQSISDKKRSLAEDELHKLYGIEVRILDRSWIIDKIVGNKREELVIQHLNIDIPTQNIVKPGEQDTVKTHQLDELKIKISDSKNYVNRQYILVEDFIRATKLAKSLELPRFETEGFINQAIRIAKQISMQSQIIRAIYQKAWTMFWWYDDIKEAYDCFKDLEVYVYNSFNSYDYELLGNLLISLKSFYRFENDSEILKEINSKIIIYLSSLKKLFDDTSKPNNSLKAKSLYYTFKIFDNYGDEEEVKVCLRKLNSILKHSEHLLHFDVLTIIQIFDELGHVFEHFQEFENLFNTICDITQTRSGEVETGRLFLTRGISNYNNKKFKEALKYFENARIRFIKEETIDEFVKCSILTSMVYKRLDLHWASRKELIFSINHLLYEFSTYGSLSSRLVNCYNELIWNELLLGRVPIILSLFQHIYALNSALITEENDEYSKTKYDQDLVLSLLLIKSNIDQLKSIPKLITILEHFGLYASYHTLKYALGYTDLPKRQGEGEITNPDDIYIHCLKQPAYKDLPDTPEYHLTNHLEYNTVILGCNIIIKFFNTESSIEFAEDLLGAIESFFASMSYKDLLITKSKIIIELKESDFTKYPGKVTLNESNSNIRILIPQKITNYQSSENQNDFKNFLLECIIMLFSQGVHSKDDNIFDKLKELADEGLFFRTLNISPSYLFNSNVFGKEKKYSISDWIKDVSDIEYPLKRSQEWLKDIPSELLLKYTKEDDTQLKEVKESDLFRHKDMQVLDQLVEERLWDKAKWNAMLYFVREDYDGNNLPKLGFVFQEQDGATNLFVDLIKKISNNDKNDLIQITFIENINAAEDYIVLFTISVDNYFKQEKTIKRFFAVKQRMQVFPKTNKEAFNYFKKAYRELMSYELFPALLKDGKFVLGLGLAIKKKELFFIDAKNVEENTFEYGVLQLYKEGKL
ncbi:MAG: hypothetical protein PVH88_10290 [Ignavibacteria bacterium]|jgi:hypothetical protein